MKVARKLNLTRLVGLIVIMAIMVASGAVLTACGKKPIDKISVVSGIPEITASRSISWSNLVIKVTRTNDKSENIKYTNKNKGSFTVPTFIETAGTQDITISYTEKSVTKSVTVSVTVADLPDLTDARVQSFGSPDYATAHYTLDLPKFRLGDEMGGDTLPTNKIDRFEVGNLNYFILAPKIRVMGLSGVWNGSYKIGDAPIFEYKLQLGTETAGGVWSFADVNAADYLDGVNLERCGFDFKDAAALNKTFKLKLTPAANIKNTLIATSGFEFTFIVRDGWNAYDLRDLQLLSNRGYYRYSLDTAENGYVSNAKNIKGEDLERDNPNVFAEKLDSPDWLGDDGWGWQVSEGAPTDYAVDYYWGGYMDNGSLVGYRNAQVETYLKSMTASFASDWTNPETTFSKYLAKNIHGMYLQRDVTVLLENGNGDNRNTLPSTFFMTNTDHRLSRGVALFDHIVRSGDTFMFNGNYFTIDAKDIPIEKPDTYNAWSQTGYSALFNFGSTQAGTGVQSEYFYTPKSVTFKNAAIKGNSKRVVDAARAEDRGAASTLSMHALSFGSFGDDNTAGSGAFIQRVLFDEVKSCASVDQQATDVPNKFSKVTLRDCKVANIYSTALSIASFADLYLVHNEFENIDAPTQIIMQRRTIPVTGTRDNTEYEWLWPDYKTYKHYARDEYQAFANKATAGLLEPDAAEFIQHNYVDMYTLAHSGNYIDISTSIWVQQMTALLGMNLGALLPPEGLIPNMSPTYNGQFSAPFVLVSDNSGDEYPLCKNPTTVTIVSNEYDTAVVGDHGEKYTMDANAEITQFMTGISPQNYYTIVGANGAVSFVTNIADTGNPEKYVKGRMLSSLSGAEIVAYHYALENVLSGEQLWQIAKNFGFPGIFGGYPGDATFNGGYKTGVVEGIKTRIPFILLDIYASISPDASVAIAQFNADLTNKITVNGADKYYMFLQIKTSGAIYDICLDLKDTRLP